MVRLTAVFITPFAALFIAALFSTSLAMADETGAIEIPSVALLPAADATAKLDAAGIFHTTRSRTVCSPTDGLVIEAVPPEGGAIDPSSMIVVLVVAEHSTYVAIPDVRGMTFIAAYDALRAAGFAPDGERSKNRGLEGICNYRFHFDEISQSDPAHGVELCPGDAVLLRARSERRSVPTEQCP